MKLWMFGQEVESFKPLRHTLKSETLQKLQPSEKLKSEGWTTEKLQNFISFKCFVDPKYKGFIRTANQLLSLNGFIIEDIFPISEFEEKENTNHIIYYVDFAKNNPLKMSSALSKKIGFHIRWMEEDLKTEGLFSFEKEDLYVFETLYFIYQIDSDLHVVSVLFKQNQCEIDEIFWEDKGFTIKTIHNEVFTIHDFYAEWLSYLNNYSHYYLPKPNKSKKVGVLFEGLEKMWIVHPKVWKIFDKTNTDREFFLNLWKIDWKKNGYFITYKKKYCEVLGWRFLYVWDGLVLTDILTPEGKNIETIEIKDNYLIVNNQIYTSLDKNQPNKITDLVCGNLVMILPRHLVMRLELHEHAILRYEQRINEHPYLSVIFTDILTDIYYHGKVEEGAHTSERRKITTNKYGYVISNEFVISVWTKNNQPQLKNKKQFRQNKKRFKTYKTLKHLEKMNRLFQIIN